MSSNFSEILLRITGSFFYILPILLFIILAIYYMGKTQSSKEGTLILIGNILILMVAIVHQFLYLFIDNLGFDLYSIINVAINGISFVGSILFLIGVYMMIQKVIKTQKNSLEN